MNGPGIASHVCTSTKICFTVEYHSYAHDLTLHTDKVTKYDIMEHVTTSHIF